MKNAKNNNKKKYNTHFAIAKPKTTVTAQEKNSTQIKFTWKTNTHGRSMQYVWKSAQHRSQHRNKPGQWWSTLKNPQRWKTCQPELLIFFKKNIDQSEGTKISAVSRQNGVAVTHRTATYIDTNYFGHRLENELWKSCLTSFKWNFLKITKNARNICYMNVNIYIFNIVKK